MILSYIPVEMEKAKDSNAPFFIELYVLKLRTGLSYIAACDEDIVFNGQTFVHIPFSREDITRSADNLFDETQVHLGDVDGTKLSYVLNGFDFRGCEVGIWKIQYPDSLKDGSCLPIFIGYLDSPSYSEGVFSCTLRSIFPTVNTPQRLYQTQCNSNFGDANCTLERKQYNVKITNVSTEGNVLTVERSFDKDFFSFGMAIICGESRNIIGNDRNNITLGINFLQSDLVGQYVILERGCDKTKECCKKFNNLKHFSGFPAIPFEANYH